MFTKMTFALVFALTTASGALVGPASAQGWQYYGNATAGAPDFAPRDVYSGSYAGADQDANALQRGGARSTSSKMEKSSK
jgi:hypothetical protein